LEDGVGPSDRASAILYRARSDINGFRPMSPESRNCHVISRRYP